MSKAPLLPSRAFNRSATSVQTPGAAFAINSSVYSYLILAYAGSEKAAEDVGFYFAANAAGCFSGTLLSGILYQWGGLTACLAGSALMLSVCFVTTLFLPARREG